MEKHLLKANPRTITGKKVKSLRTKGVVPANIFGKGIDSVQIQVDKLSFLPVYKEAGETGIVELDLESEKRPTLIYNVTKNPITDDILHIDFRQVDLKEKVTTNVPVEVIGESPAEKSGLGTAVQQMDEIEIEALPADILEKFVVDISSMTEVDQAIFVSDLKYDKSKIEVKSDPEKIIVKVEPQQKEEIAAVPEVAAEEGESTVGESPKEEETKSTEE